MVESERRTLLSATTTGSAKLSADGRELTKYLARGIGLASNLLVSTKLKQDCAKNKNGNKATGDIFILNLIEFSMECIRSLLLESDQIKETLLKRDFFYHLNPF